MKKLISGALFIFFLLLLTNNGVYAQSTLSRAEKKALKKEIKAYKKAPETYKSMKDKTRNKIESLEAEIEDLRNQLAKEWKKADSLEAVLAESSNKVSELETAVNELEKASINCGKVPSRGTVYSVQIGNYKVLDLRNSFNANKGLRTENYTGGNAYMIGNFTTVQEAVQFAADIKKLGISDAFVTQYIDGNRMISFDANR